MGLDMYAFTTTDNLESEVDFKADNYEELHYWRKHPDLHGWMKRLYYEKGGTAELFNTVSVALSEEDLVRLDSTVLNSELPQTSGFFFGVSDGSEKGDDLAFIRKARESIREGKTVFYYSWW